ncbi:hypothetical protein BGZ46_004634 [Entomortierella lignicola]|nr:hypothetical protein BGZ46_004634 [Entomortierella lignicola]
MNHLAWILNRIEDDKPATMPAFAKHFGFICERDAHDAFSAIITSSEIPQRIREGLQNNYDVWQRNHGKDYWASISASSQIKISTKTTATQLSMGGEQIVRKIIKEQIEEDASKSPDLRKLLFPELSSGLQEAIDDGRINNTSQISMELEYRKTEVIELKKKISCLERDLDAALEYWTAAELNFTALISEQKLDHIKHYDKGRKVLDEVQKQRFEDLRVTNKELESKLEHAQDETRLLLVKLAQHQKKYYNLLENNNTLRSIAKEHEECCVQRQGRMPSQGSSISQLPIKNSVEFHTTTPTNTTIPTDITIEQTCDILTDAQNLTHDDPLSDREDKEGRCNENSRRESFRKDKAVSSPTIKELGNQSKSRKRHRGDNPEAVEPSSKGDLDFKMEKEKQDTKRLKEEQKTKRSTEETERARISLKQKEVELEILKVQLQLKNNG